jgi:hypothetical protein
MSVYSGAHQYAGNLELKVCSACGTTQPKRAYVPGEKPGEVVCRDARWCGKAQAERAMREGQR